jgi:O-antigen/teichoic acid export membrane protein
MLSHTERRTPEAESQGDDRAATSHRAVIGAFWVFISLAGARVLTFIPNLILARFLSPADFGLVSFAMVLIGAFALMQDLGVPAAIVYGRRDVREVAGTALTINVAAAVLLFGLVALASPLLASHSGNATTAPIATALAATLVIAALGSVQNAFLVKELSFRRKLLPDVLPLVGSGITSIVAALMGLQAWSLVIGYLVRRSLSTLLLWLLSSVRVRPTFRWSVAVELLAYGKHASLASIIGFLAGNIDYIIVGYLLGSSELGVYTMAYTIANIPPTFINSSIVMVAFPIFSKIRDDAEHLREIFENIMEIALLLSVPPLIAMFVLSNTLTIFVLGGKWASVNEPLQVLIVFSLLRCIAGPFGPVYKALGRPQLEWALTLTKLATSVPLMFWAAPRYGILGVAVVHVLTGGLLIPLGARYVSQLLGMGYGAVWRGLLPHVIGLVVAGAVIAVSAAVSETEHSIDKLLVDVGTVACASIAYLGMTVSLSRRSRKLTWWAIGTLRVFVLNKGSVGRLGPFAQRQGSV